MSWRYRFAIIVGVLIPLAAFTVLIMGTLSSGEVNAQAECALHTLNGTYVFEGEGVIIDGEEAVPYAEAGWQTFDGEGNSVGIFSFSLAGEALSRQESFTSTYELNPDQECVFTVFAPVGDEVVTFDLYGTREGTNFSYFGPGFSGRLMKP